MEYLEKVAAYEDDILYDLAEDEAYDLAYEKTAATRFKELMNIPRTKGEYIKRFNDFGSGNFTLSKKSVGRLNDLGYLNPRIRKEMNRITDTGNTGMARDYRTTLFGKKKPLEITHRDITPAGSIIPTYKNTRGKISRRFDREAALEAAQQRNARKVTNRWAREMANANGGHLTPELAHQLRVKSIAELGYHGQI